MVEQKIKYKRAFKRYRDWVESMPGWETSFCGYGYDTFVMVCKENPIIYKRFIREEENIIPYIKLKKHKMI